MMKRRMKFRFLPNIRFTLVEMLVVIAIVAILAAMIMPALNNSLESARTVSCTNNQKNTYMAYAAYCDVYNGFIPKKTATYNPFDIHCGQTLYAGSSSASRDPQVFICPSVYSAPEWTSMSMMNTDGTYKRPIYWPNCDLWLYTSRLQNPKNIKGKLSPASAVLLGEADVAYVTNANGLTGGGLYIFDWNPERCGWWHNSNAAQNMVYFDGHVAPVWGADFSDAWLGK